MSLDLRKTQKKKRKLVGGTAEDDQTNIIRSPVKTAVRVRVQVTKIWKRDNKNLERNITTLIRDIPKFDGAPSKFQDWKRATKAMPQLVGPGIFEILDGQKGRTKFTHRCPIGAP